MSVRGFLLFGSLAVLAGGIDLNAQTLLTLPADTPVRLHTDQNVSSANAQIGTTVQLVVIDDIQTNGVVIIPHGTVVFATVTDVHSQAQSTKGGLLKLKLTDIRLTNGIQVALGLQPASQTQTVAAVIAGATLANPLVVGGPSPLAVSAAGSDATIPKGTEVIAYFKTSLTVNSDKLASTPGAVAENAPPAVPARGPMTNEVVLVLKQAGLSDNEMIARIKASPANYRLEPADIAALKDATLSQAVVQAMVEAQSRK
jgi:hypothetical protein